MLKRKAEAQISDYLTSTSNKMLIVEGARQIGKSYLIRHLGSKLYENFIEINMEEDRLHDRLFADATTIESFYLTLSTFAGDRMGTRENTLVFIDEIQAYPHLLTLTKFLMQDGRFRYIASGAQLGIALKKSTSVPVGSIEILRMYPLDFVEFLWANHVGDSTISAMQESFVKRQPLPEAIHNKIMDLFRRYLLTGGLPDAINTYLEEHNIVKVRAVQRDIITLYKTDAAKYEQESMRRLKIERIYDMIPSNMESRRKRVVIKDIEGKAGKRTSNYTEEFEYLVSSGIALEVDAISQPRYPLIQNSGKNLLKLYMNDVGLLTCLLYGNNIKPVLNDIDSINLGAVYETVVAQELAAHGFKLFYYDNKKNGEVDFLIDDNSTLSSLPIEVKSGKDYIVHSALDRFLSNPDYNVHEGFVLSNNRMMRSESHIIYAPIYDIMFFSREGRLSEQECYF